MALMILLSLIGWKGIALLIGVPLGLMFIGEILAGIFGD